jgi:putative addiction module component (TIGR02574 family)
MDNERQDAAELAIDASAELRAELDRRFDDFKSGRVKPVSAEEVIARIRAKRSAKRAASAAIRQRRERG